MRGWAGGAGGGVGGGPPPGRRPAAAGRISTAAVRRDRLRDGWEGPGGEGGPGGRLAAVVRGGGGRDPSPGVTAPPRQQQLAESRGRGSETCVAALSPLPALPPAGVPREGAPPAGARRCRRPRGRGTGGPGRPSHGATALPAPAAASSGVRRGWGGLSPVRPGRVTPSGSGEKSATARRAPPRPPLAVSGRRGGGSARCSRRARASERTGSAAMSATHPTRLETRTKESNTCASRGLARKPPWRNEGEGRRRLPAVVGRGGIPRPFQSAEGAPPARLARRAGEVEHERTC